jgi:phosphoribosylglycinamide formyltransferase-1
MNMIWFRTPAPAVSEPFSIIVFASGGGGNFQALVDARDELGMEIKLLVADRKCNAIVRAKDAGIPTLLVEGLKGAEMFSRVFEESIPAEVDLLVLAGFMPIVPGVICEKWKRRIINTHPSLLPKHGGVGMYGVKVQEAVMRAGDKVAGCTVHYVTEAIDGGDIILQKAIEVDPRESAWELGGRIFKEENQLLVEAVRLIKSSAVKPVQVLG